MPTFACQLNSLIQLLFAPEICLHILEFVKKILKHDYMITLTSCEVWKLNIRYLNLTFNIVTILSLGMIKAIIFVIVDVKCLEEIHTTVCKDFFQRHCARASNWLICLVPYSPWFLNDMVDHLVLRTTLWRNHQYCCQNFISLRENIVLRRGSQPFSTFCVFLLWHNTVKNLKLFFWI